MKFAFCSRLFNANKSDAFVCNIFKENFIAALIKAENQPFFPTNYQECSPSTSSTNNPFYFVTEVISIDCFKLEINY